MSDPKTNRILIWDFPTRAFHWLLAILIVVSFVSAEAERFDVHFLSGYSILVLVIFRLVWGVVGGETARFVTFLKGPCAVLSYFASLIDPKAADPEGKVGHNPGGALMIVAVLATVLAQALTGLFTTDDVLVDGPLTALAGPDTVSMASQVHRLIPSVLIGLIVVHIAAVLGYLLVRREDLITPMITGMADAADGTKPPRMVSLARAAFVLAGAVALIALVIGLA